MSRRPNPALGVASVLLLAGCAGASHELGAGTHYAFPDEFDVTQAVTVASSSDDTREVLASLRRRAGDYDVTLFDPVFAVPVVTASLHGGVAHEEVLAPGVPAGQGKRLVSLLSTLYGSTFPLPRAGSSEAASGGFSFRLGEIVDGAACPFPAVIDVSPRLGRWPTLHVRTLEVTCSPGQLRRVEHGPVPGQEVVDDVP